MIKREFKASAPRLGLAGLVMLIAACTLTTAVAAGAQSNATITLNKAVFEAGEMMQISITPDPVPSYDGQLQLYCTDDIGNNFWIFAALHKNQAVDVINWGLADDIATGTYRIIQGSFGQGQRHPIKFAPLSFSVTGAKGLVSPKSLGLTLDLSQKQLLRSDARNLQDALDVLIEDLNKNSVDSPALRRKLITTLEFAQKELDRTHVQYSALIGKTLDPNPIFFQDFARRYEAALIELRAADLKASNSASQPHILEVQFLKRENQDDPRLNFHGSYPLEAERVVDMIEENIAAYKLVETTGSDSFTIHLGSIPSGASISYARIGEPFKDYSSQTDVVATFPLARWIFVFTKAGCKTVTRSPDPFIERNPDLTVELSCARK